MRPPVYLDYAATTPVDVRVAKCLSAYLTREGVFGNPGSEHRFGWAAAEAVEQARQQVAAVIGADAREIVWTSGATEADNLALQGAALADANRGRHLITVKTEHKAVLDVCQQLSRQGFRITYLNPQSDGLITPEQLAEAIDDDTQLVSVMHVNNELGVVQDIAALSAVARAQGVLFHVDAAQSMGRLPIDVEAWGVDLLSLCAHKAYGPKGIGALYVRRRPRVRLQALLHGGGQERGLRAGTLPTQQIVAMAETCRLAEAERVSEAARIATLRDRLLTGLRVLPAVCLHGHAEQRVPHILNLSFAGIDAEALLLGLDDIALSSGAACSSADREPSHVLKAIGLDPITLAASVRISLGRFTTVEEIDYVVTRMVAEVERLRDLSPLWTDCTADV